MNETLNHPKISVIVPVYKAEAYLRCCVDSLLAQTFRDFEILLIDDGSPDKSGEICDEYARQDGRIKALHKKNGGVSSARNVGIEHAQGEWITFVDADDYVKSAYLTDFGLADLKANDKSVLIYQGISYWKSGVTSPHFHYQEDDSRQSGDSIIERNMLFMDGCPVGKLFRKDVLTSNNIKFDIALSLHEDHVFVFNCFLHTQRIITREAQNYLYRIDYNPDSLTQRALDSEGLIRAGKLLIHYNQLLFAKYKVSRKAQRVFITHYGINQLYKAICYVGERQAEKILAIKSIMRPSFIIRNYSFCSPLRFFAALLFSLTPTPVLVAFFKITK